MLGIFVGAYDPIDNKIVIFIGLAVFLLALYYLAYLRLKRTWWYAIVFNLCFAFVGYSMVSVHYLQRGPADFSNYCPENYTWAEVVLQDMPTQSEKTVKVKADVLKIQDSTGWHSVTGKVMLFFRKDSLAQQLGYGDKLLVYTKITEVAPPQNPYQFNYKEYLQRKGIYYQAYISSDQYRVTHPASESNIFSVAYSLRLKMISLIKRSGLSLKEQGIASALLLGWDEDIDEETHQSFSNAGIAHFLSISGLHLGIIFMFIGYMFFWMGNSRRSRMIRGFVQLVVLWFFAVITGLSPSILRAATMFSLITVGEMFFTRASFYNNLASSAFILLLFRPLLLFDVGFQLSYLGVIGIVVLQPRIKELINIPTNLKIAQSLQNSWNQSFATSAFGKVLAKSVQVIVNAVLWLVQKVWELTCVSVAAQLATLPLTFYYFHLFSHCQRNCDTLCGILARHSDFCGGLLVDSRSRRMDCETAFARDNCHNFNYFLCGKTAQRHHQRFLFRQNDGHPNRLVYTLLRFCVCQTEEMGFVHRNGFQCRVPRVCGLGFLSEGGTA